MSFSVSFRVKYDEVEGKLAADSLTPECVKEFITLATKALKQNMSINTNGVAVMGYGHLHTGEEGNYSVSNVTLSITPVVIETESAPPA